MSLSPSDPPFAKRRLPFPEQISLAQSGRKRVGLFLLLIAAMLCVGAAYYALKVRGLGVSAPEFLAPALGCVYFGLRVFLAVRPRPNS